MKGEIIIDDRDTLEDFKGKYTPEEIEQMFFEFFGFKPGEEPPKTKNSSGNFIVHRWKNILFKQI